MTATASFSGEAWHHASLPSTRRHSMRLPVNVARGFTPVSEVDMEDDWRPSTGMTSTASFGITPAYLRPDSTQRDCQSTRHAALMPVPEVDMEDDWRPSTAMTTTDDGVFLRRGLTSRQPASDQAAPNETASQCGTRIHAGA